ncbi:MAG: PQQ-dependent sugar dehydrogenase [Gammaproteobacteria bacterium]|nr:PQQ-dependent sugar dehydrogenase [Gammaproteobacteria bacterium]
MKTLTSLLLSISFCLISSSTVAYQFNVIAEDLDFPWSIAFLPNGDLLVTELGGNLRRVSLEGEVSEPIAGVPVVYRMSQGGLFDVLLHPDFERNQTIYLSFAHGRLDDNATRIVRARLVGDQLVDSKDIFTVTPSKNTPVHYGGRMRFLPDGHLLLTTGDGFDFREAAQDKHSLLGKTIRITDDGEFPATNPFVDADGNPSPVWTFGHRNPQGLAIAADGTVYLHEHGPRGGDETNVLKRGANYGWPAITHGVDYNGAYVSPFSAAEGMEQPLTVWVPSIGPSGLAVYEGERFPDWQGDLFVGALVDTEVRRLDMEDGEVIGETSLFTDELGGRRVRDVRTNDGYLYIVTDGPNGQIIRIEPSS